MIRVLTIYATALILSINLSDVACTQDHSGSSSIARIVYIEDIPQAGSGTLKGSLNALRQETERLKKTLSVNQAEASSPNPTPQSRLISSAPAPPPVHTPPTHSVDRRTPTKLAPTKDIHERIELLKQIYEQRKEAQANIVAPVDPQRQSTLPAESSTVPSSTGAAANAPTVGAGQVDSVVSKAVVRDATLERPTLAAPADLFELGNSLYQTGDLRTAFEVYSQVDRTTITVAEAVWLDFMIASCHRRMGNWKDAISLYRGIANQNAVANLAKPAQVWLKQVELLSESESSFSQLETQIESLLEKARTHVAE